MSGLAPDAAQLGRFTRRVFAHASSGGVVSLRAFVDTAAEAVFKIRPVRINGSLDPVVTAAVDLAAACAAFSKPVVFCPPLATFTTTESASERNLREGLTLSVELDARPVAARAKLTALLGSPTFTVESGGEWTDPETGEIQAKLHLHWLLREPTTTAAEHALLKRARALACDLVGADATSKAVVHPIRWPGSWHRKGTPRLARIVEETRNEIDLTATLEELEGLAALRGSGTSDGDNGVSDLDAATLLACAERIANTTATEWAEWNRLGMAFYRASGGSKAGFAAFDSWSRKNAKYNKDTTEARWKHYAKAPPTKIGAGTLVYEARKSDPDFLRSSAGLEVDTGADRRPFTPPVFSDSAMPGAWGQLVRLWEPWTEAHPASIVLPGLVMLGTHGGEGVRIGQQRAVEYLALIGPSTIGRKDTGTRIAADFVQSVGGRRSVLGQPNSGEGIWYALRDPADGDPGAPDKRLCLLDTEMASTLAASHRPGSTVLPALLSLYDDGTREPLTKRDRVKVSDAMFSYIGLTTPEQFVLHLTDADRHSGLLQRLLTAAVQRVRLVAPSRALNPEVDELALSALAEAVRNRMDEAVRHGRTWRLSQAAREHFDEVADRLVDPARPETGRGHTHALRLAMIYALTVPPDPVDAEERTPGLVTMSHLYAGIAAWDYCSQSAAILLSNNTLVEKIVALAEDAGEKGLTLTELFRLTGNNISAAELKEAIHAGKQQGLLQVNKVLRPGQKGRSPWLVQST